MLRKVLILCLLFVSAVAAADETQFVLTTGGVAYAVDNTARGELRLIRRSGETRDTIVVPTTEDAALESQAQLLWDDATETLFVVWHRSADRSDQILLTRMDSEGNWSDSFLIATGSGAKRAGLQVAMTKAVANGKTATLVHAAWWSINANPVAEYALVAFEDGQHLSTVVTDLQQLAGSTGGFDFEDEPVREVLHPPLAMARSGSGAGVDIVFGAPNSTRLTRLIANPRVRPDARLWKPGKAGGGVTPKSGLMSANGDPVKAILSRGRIVLYTPDTKFRFVMYQNGQWTPERMIQLDSKLTKEQMVAQLYRTVEQLEMGDEEPVGSVVE